MATKKILKKEVKKVKPIAKAITKKATIAKPVVKKAAAKPTIKPAAKKIAAKPVAKKIAPVSKKVVTKPVTKKVAAKPVPKKATPKPTAKPVAKKATAVIKKEVAKPTPKKVVVKPVGKVTKQDTKVTKPTKVVKPAKPTKAEKPPKPPKPVKPPKPPKPPKKVKPAPIVLSAKEIAAQKKAIKEALLKELDKKLPEPPPPPVHKRKVEEKNKKPIVIPKVNAKTSQPYKPEFTKSIMDAPKVESSVPLVRYNDTDLAEFREIINRKIEAAKRELIYLQGLITRKDEMGGDTEDSHYMTMEDGSMSMEREQLSQLAGRQITYVDHLEKAIMRIENKTYGICRVTSKLIDKARLRAVPHATLSIEAKMMQK